MHNSKSIKESHGSKTYRLSLLSFAVASALSLAACGGGGDSSGSGPNGGGGSNDAPPTVTAEARTLVSAGNSVTLTASATDPDGDAISYSWTQVSGAPISNTSGFSTASASFSAPDEVDSIVLRVTATANGRSDSAQVQVLVLEDTTTAIFVDSEFSGTSTGSIDAPFTNLASVLDGLAEQADVYIKTPSGDARLNVKPTPSENLFLSGGNSIYGGFSADWSRDIQNNRTGLTATENGILYRNVDSPTVVSGVDLLVESVQIDDSFNIIGVYAQNGSSSFTLDNATVLLEDFDENSVDGAAGASYGVYFDAVDTTTVSNSDITSGRSKNASNRGARTVDAGRDGVDGEDARVGLNINGGEGGKSTGGGWNGGDGGNAGNNSFEPGEDGTRGSGREVPLVRGGSPGSGGFDTDNSTPEGRDGGNGGSGDPGVRGTPGTGGTGFGSITSEGIYSRSFGDQGGNGFAGGGGGGGGGGAGGAAGANGGGGGGGGEGGDGGAGGFGGRSGFASIAVHIAGGNSHNIINNQITSGNGGRGGVGGTGAAGGAGGLGGEGADGTNGPANAKGGRGGNGGSGGQGGRGGSGGSGGGGPSFGIFIGGSTPATINNNVITTGRGGNGGAADFTNETDAAGRGGWSVAIFDGNASDSLTPIISGNSFTLGEAGQDGIPREASGQRSNTNF
ncbi:hypothetical protein [Glaciecola sp. SC05]|uniref:PKD domain-containing protein n=1 Tax=Glaciecola sp. SC05 TaxID=1987355 RepID=UPI003528F7CD